MEFFHMAPAHTCQIQGGSLPNTLGVGVYVTKPHWLEGGRGEKGGNRVTTPKATPKDLLIPMMKPFKSPQTHPTSPLESRSGTFSYIPTLSYESNTLGHLGGSVG